MGYQLYFAQAFSGILNIVMLPVAAAITERRKLRDGLMAAFGTRRTRQPGFTQVSASRGGGQADQRCGA
jgi:hypothetical protein